MLFVMFVCVFCVALICVCGSLCDEDDNDDDDL